MKDRSYLKREKFLECDWKIETAENSHYNYSTVMGSLQNLANKMLKAGKTDQYEILSLLSKAASMRLIPSSLNEPFKPLWQDFQSGKRSTIPEDFLEDELSFFEQIVNDINEPYLKARLADLLCLLRKDKRRVDHALIAIESYIMPNISSQTWHRDTKQHLERAARLSIQFQQRTHLEKIKSLIFTSFLKDYPDSKFLKLDLAVLLDKLRIDQDLISQISKVLYEKAEELKNNKDFLAAISHFELAAKKYQQNREKEKYIESLLAIAECYEQEADNRSISNDLAAGGFYENAVQAYRRIPTKVRETYDINNKIKKMRMKMTASGQVALDAMVSFRTRSIDLTELIEASINYVKGKSTIEEALLFFTSVTIFTDYEKLRKEASESLKGGGIANLFSGIHLNKAGHVIARTPGMNLNAGDDDQANLEVLSHNIQQRFSLDIQIAVQSQILPALRQLLSEYVFTKEQIINICNQSPLVSKDRILLLANALWLGFEEEFGLAIHLLCPQVEHIVRIKLKEYGVITVTTSPQGTETENGLSTLLSLPETEEIFGKNLTFALKGIFTEVLGYNLRNNVAHGLINDEESLSAGSIYAWWIVLRLVFRTIIIGQIKDN